MVSGSISLPLTGFFSPFPHGTCSLSVTRTYLALEDGPPRFSQDNTCPDLLGYSLGWSSFRVRDYHPLWSLFPKCSTNHPSPCCKPHDPGKINPSGLGYTNFARHYFRYLVWFLFLQVLRCFSSLRSLICAMNSHKYTSIKKVGFPIRKPPGQSLLGSSPKFIAAFHVLHRFLVPRHPPYALICLFYDKTYYQQETPHLKESHKFVFLCKFEYIFL